MRIGFDLTGAVLAFAVVGLVFGYVLGRIGRKRLLFGVILIIAALLFWHHQGVSDRLGREAIGHAIILLGTIWATVVMIVTYVIVRLIRRENAQQVTEGLR